MLNSDRDECEIHIWTHRTWRRSYSLCLAIVQEWIHGPRKGKRKKEKAEASERDRAENIQHACLLYCESFDFYFPFTRQKFGYTPLMSATDLPTWTEINTFSLRYTLCSLLFLSQFKLKTFEIFFHNNIVSQIMASVPFCGFSAGRVHSQLATQRKITRCAEKEDACIPDPLGQWLMISGNADKNA